MNNEDNSNIHRNNFIHLKSAYVFLIKSAIVLLICIHTGVFENVKWFTKDIRSVMTKSRSIHILPGTNSVPLRLIRFWHSYVFLCDLNVYIYTHPARFWSQITHKYDLNLRETELVPDRMLININFYYVSGKYVQKFETLVDVSTLLLPNHDNQIRRKRSIHSNFEITKEGINYRASTNTEEVKEKSHIELHNQRNNNQKYRVCEEGLFGPFLNLCGNVITNKKNSMESGFSNKKSDFAVTGEAMKAVAHESYNKFSIFPEYFEFSVTSLIYARILTSLGWLLQTAMNKDVALCTIFRSTNLKYPAYLNSDHGSKKTIVAPSSFNGGKRKDSEINFYMEHLSSQRTGTKNKLGNLLKHNIPANGDVVYGTYINRTAKNFQNIASQTGCASGFIRCASGTDQCVPINKWCDSEVDCLDASDETACSCKARLPKSRICDGYLDCPIGEDEWGCYSCHASEFSCYSNLEEFRTEKNSFVKLCYNKFEQCDGFKNCANGRDEKECNMIVAKIGNQQSYVVSYMEGYLYRNYRGKWYPVCGNVIKWAREACGNEVDSLNKNPELLVKKIIFPGPFIVFKSEFEEPVLSESCVRRYTHDQENVITYVKCPEVKCGLVEKEILKSSKTVPISNKLETYETLFRRNENRVVGGMKSRPMEWPFIVAIYRDGIFHCGGVIYNQRWVITAAHCVLNYDLYYFEIKAGLLRRSSYSPTVQTIVVERIIPHEFYNRQNMKNDIALAYLKKPLLYNRWVRPICMPDRGRASMNKDWIWGPEKGSVCTVVGWGAVREGGSSSDYLMHVEVPIVGRCKEKYDQDNENLCAGETNGGRDACQGDSGGPLLCRSILNSNEFYLAGIVSHGEGCARPEEPGVYTRIALYIDWIKFGIANIDLTTKHPSPVCPGFSCIWAGITCINDIKRCNKIVDCLGGEDEVECAFDQVENPRHLNKF